MARVRGPMGEGAASRAEWAVGFQGLVLGGRQIENGVSIVGGSIECGRMQGPGAQAFPASEGRPGKLEGGCWCWRW